jgi:hypothetical protein
MIATSLVHLARTQPHSDYCFAFIDISSAYDSIVHQDLFQTLTDMKFPNHAIAIVTAMLQGVAPVVKIEGMVSESFSMQKGLRQGCPMSPFLFNLIMAGFDAYIRQRCRGDGINLTPLHRVYSLLYADDIFMPARCRDGLLRMLEAANDYCKAHNLNISLEKSNVLYLGSSNGGIQCSFGEVKQAMCYKYLGILLSNNLHKSHKQRPRLQIGWGKAVALLKAAMSSGVMYNLQVARTLMLSVLMPTISYGAQFSALTPTLLLNPFANPLDKCFRWFYKRFMGLPATGTPNWLPLMMGGIWPIAYWVIKEAMSTWNEIRAMSVSSVHMAALLQLLYRLYAEHHTGWLHQLLSCWNEVSSDIHDKLLCLQQVGDHDVHQALEIWFLAMLSMQLGHPMDDQVSSHLSCVALSTWNGQFAPQHLALLSQHKSPHVISRLVHHCWPLQLHEHDVPMDERRCRFCGDDVESEWHVLLHCPILDLVRAQYPELDFSGTLQHLLAQSSSSRLVDYLLEVFHLLH